MSVNIMTSSGLVQVAGNAKGGENVTYTLSKDESNYIVLSGSDGSIYKVKDSGLTDEEKGKLDTMSSDISSSTEPSGQNIGDIWTEPY